MKPAPSSARPPTVAVRFRNEIEQAASRGVAADDMTLHLTLGDVEQLKRDRNIAVSDISFVGGTMTYLGVKVLKGETPLSALSCGTMDTV
ncbi:MAG TPA: hypothetical protein VGM25_01330 [Caulobacteraceae bacterium]